MLRVHPTSTSPSYEALSKVEMNKLLERFFLSCRLEDGSDYKASSMATMRQNLIRAIKLSHQFDLVGDEAFMSSSCVFINRLKTLKSSGKGDVSHHKDIPTSDLRKIITKLDEENPKQLMLLVWFYVHLFFCRRGMENVSVLKKDHYCIKVVEGKTCLVQNRDELTKNHREKDISRMQGSVVPEQNHQKCP